jgi:hypothetical protein
MQQQYICTGNKIKILQFESTSCPVSGNKICDKAQLNLFGDIIVFND